MQSAGTPDLKLSVGDTVLIEATVRNLYLDSSTYNMMEVTPVGLGTNIITLMQSRAKAIVPKPPEPPKPGEYWISDEVGGFIYKIAAVVDNHVFSFYRPTSQSKYMPSSIAPTVGEWMGARTKMKEQQQQ